MQPRHGPCSGFVGISRAGIEAVAETMDAEKRDRRVGPEDVLRAVAVMHVPIDKQDAVQAERFAGMMRGQRDIVEQAEAHALVHGGMMSRRAHQAQSRPVQSAHHLVDAGDARSRSR